MRTGFHFIFYMAKLEIKIDAILAEWYNKKSEKYIISGGIHMKKLVVKDKNGCMACLSCVRACSEAFYKEFDPDKSCIQIVSKTGTDATVKTCIQCGKCARNCEAGAIKQNAKGVYMVDKKLCTGCGKCAEVCPMGVMVKAETSPVASKCIACGICAKVCPMDILAVEEK